MERVRTGGLPRKAIRRAASQPNSYHSVIAKLTASPRLMPCENPAW